jgi:hypothetical protein
MPVIGYALYEYIKLKWIFDPSREDCDGNGTSESIESGNRSNENNCIQIVDYVEVILSQAPIDKIVTFPVAQVVDQAVHR